MIKPEQVRPEDEARVHRGFSQKVNQLDEHASGVIGTLLENARTLYALVKDKSFEIPWQDKAKIIAALLYFINPLDLVPDVIPGLGYVDDALVLGWVLKSLTDLVGRYKQHREGKTPLLVPDK